MVAPSAGQPAKFFSTFDSFQHLSLVTSLRKHDKLDGQSPLPAIKRAEHHCIPKGISGKNTLDAATSHGQQPAGHQQIHGQHCYQPQHRTTSAPRKENSPTSQPHTTIQQKEYLHHTFNTHTRNQQPKSAASFVIEKENDAPSLVADSSPSQHAAPADQHGKASSSAQLALVCHQERHPASFAEVLRCGLVAATEGLLGAAMDAVSFGFPTVAEFEDDPVVDSSHSPHDALNVHHVKAPALEVDLDLTPNSITRLSSKYSLDVASHVGPDTITPRGSLADFREGRALDAPRVESFQTSYRSAKDVIAMQYRPWKQAKSRRQRKSASEISKGSSGTFSSNVVSALAVIRQMVSCGKQLWGVDAVGALFAEL
ncbi:hypothetical protein Nepgr_021709 [Nepenthes gracilis]|uniref:Uncharacterized protein n=1 Tax=Nepenthes gracilis TaxID=150966 RepID=A0AAD3SYU1_NEPGR|nr:hypothetical protein Nepgr_021709 [Nepenthes gracilis]